MYVLMKGPHRNIIPVDNTHIESKTDDPTRATYTVYLKDNPLVCGCKLYTFVKNIKENNEFIISNTTSRVDFVKVNKLACASPPHLKGRLLKETLYNLTCPIKEKGYDCPTGCQCLYRPKGDVNVIDCTSAELTTLPDPLPVLHQTHLLAGRNNISEVQYPSNYRQYNVTLVDLSYNGLTTFTISGELGPLKELNLSNDKLHTLPLDTFPCLINAEINLDNNPWTCGCDDSQFIEGAMQMVPNLTCADGRAIEVVRTSCIKREYKVMLAIGLTIAVMVTVVSVGVASFFRYKEQIFIFLYNSNLPSLQSLVAHPEYLSKLLKYDAFISFTHLDDDFVSRHLLPEIEGRYKLCLHFKDWKGGEWITTNIMESIDNSKRVIIVMSPDYLRSKWGRFEFKYALTQAMVGKLTRLIVIMYKDVNKMDLDKEIRSYINSTTYLEWEDTPSFWDRVHYSMPHPEDEDQSWMYRWWGKRSRERQLGIVLEEMMKLRTIVPDPNEDSDDNGSQG